MNIKSKAVITAVLSSIIVVCAGIGVHASHKKPSTIELVQPTSSVKAAYTDSGSSVAAQTTTNPPQTNSTVQSSKPTTTTPPVQAPQYAAPPSYNYTPPAPTNTCTDEAKQNIELTYTAAIGSEDARHQSAIDSINADYNSRGLGFSGMAQAARDAENSRHSNNTANITTAHDNSLKNICG